MTIKSRASNAQFRENYDRIFRKAKADRKERSNRRNAKCDCDTHGVQGCPVHGGRRK